MLSNHRLRILRELRRRGTMGRVAAALKYSSSAISQQLALLETEAGAKLIEPVGRGVRLTIEGELLADHAERILRDVEEAEAALEASTATVAGRLRVATFQSAALTVMPTVLRELARTHPQLVIQLAEFQPDLAISRLVAHDYDLVLGEEYEGQELARDTEVDQEDLLFDPLEIVISPEVELGRPDPSLNDLRQLPWVMESSTKPARIWTRALCRRAGFEPEVRFESDDLLVHRVLVASGHAVAMLPRLLSSHEPVPLRVIALPGSPTRRIFTAVRAGAIDRPAVRACRDALRNAVQAVTVPSAGRSSAER